MPKHAADAPKRRRSSGIPDATTKAGTTPYQGKRVANTSDLPELTAVASATPTVAGKRAARPAPGTRTRVSFAMKMGAVAGVAVAATGVVIAGGVTSNSAVVAAQTQSVTGAVSGAGAGGGAEVSAARRAAILAERSQRAFSRSDQRAEAAKANTLSTDQGGAMAQAENLADADPRTIGRALLPLYGFDASEFSCLDSLYVSESDWRIDADNPYSSAYGIPQAMTSLHDLPADYYTSAEAQIRWGLDYISNVYGTPCSAWSFKQGNGWY